MNHRDLALTALQAISPDSLMTTDQLLRLAQIHATLAAVDALRDIESSIDAGARVG